MSNDHWLARIELAEARANAAEAERDRYREALTIIFLMDDVLIDITDGYDPIPRLRHLPPWRAVMLARVAEKCGLIERPVLDALIAEASAVGGAGALAALAPNTEEGAGIHCQPARPRRRSTDVDRPARTGR